MCYQIIIIITVINSNESAIAGMSLVIIVTLAVGIWLAILAIGIVCLRKYVDLLFASLHYIANQL